VLNITRVKCKSTLLLALAEEEFPNVWS